MANYRVIHDRISKGRGKAAQRVGQIYSVHRLTPTGFVRVVEFQNCLLRRIHGGYHVEQNVFVSEVFEMLTDVRGLLVGDYLEEHPDFVHAQKRVERVVRDIDSDASSVGEFTGAWAPIYYLAQMRPIHKFIGVRMDVQCQVRRGRASIVDGDGGYMDQGENAEDVLTLPLGKGEFVWQDTKTVDTINKPAALIPFQLEASSIRGRPPFDLPLDWNSNHWYFACPSVWKGLIIRENDHIFHPDGNRFRVLGVIENQIGLQITQGLLEKLES